MADKRPYSRTPEGRRGYDRKYNAEKRKKMSLTFCPPEMDLYEWIRAQGNASGYLKGLAREDRRRRG